MTGNIHPMEERYQTKEMAELFTEEAKLYQWLRVEKCVSTSPF